MKISALAPWYGSKRTIAPRIVEAFGPHRCYWELLCGSCAVLFAKERCSYETVNDLHEDIINLALVVQAEETALALYGRVKRCLFHEDLLPIARTFLTGRPLEPGQPDVERAYWYLVWSWQGLNGVAGTPLRNGGSFAVRFSAKGGNGATRWASVADSIPDWHERLLGVQVLQRDAFEILPRLDDAEGTVLYVDPPYLVKGSSYLHDLVPEQHEQLAQELRRFREARVVLSYYDHPSLADLYPDWAKVHVGVTKALVQAGKRDQRGRTEAPEVLLCNQPAAVAAASLF